MTKITTDFTGVEPSATRLSRLNSIYDFWWGTGAFALAGTLGTVRTTMNTIAPDDTSNGEAFGSWLTKWNALNEPDKLLNDTLKDANPALFVLADDTARVFGADGVTAVSAPGSAVSLIGDDWEGLELGDNIITTSAFGPGLGWTSSGGAVFGAGWSLITTASGGAFADTGNLPNLTNPDFSTSKVYAVRLIGEKTGAGDLAWRNASNTTGQILIPTGQIDFRGVFKFDVASWFFQLTGGGAQGLTLTTFEVREVLNWPAYQNTTAARPTWGRAPAQVRNLLERTEEFVNAYWTKTNITLTSGIADPIGGTGAFTFTAAAANGTVSRSVGSLAAGGTISAYVRRRTGTGAVQMWDGNSYNNIVVTGAWERITVSQEATSTGFWDMRLTVSGDAVDVAFPQVETGSTATAYQRRGPNATDITEAGVTSFGLLSFDGSDDALLHQLAAGGTVAVALFGRGGSYLIPSITLAAPSVLQLGPLSVLDDGVLVSGCPTGILQAVGTVPWSSRFELVGYAIMKANPTAEEKARAMRYFAAHGARGWLVEGANLVPPNIDGDGWGTDVFPSSPATRSGVQVTFSTTFSHWRQTVPVDFAGQWFRHQFTARLISGNANLNFYLPTLGVSPQAGQAGTGITVTSTAQTFTLDVFSTAGSSQPMSFGIQDRNASGFGTVEITNASLTKFTPEF